MSYQSTELTLLLVVMLTVGMAATTRRDWLGALFHSLAVGGVVMTTALALQWHECTIQAAVEVAVRKWNGEMISCQDQNQGCTSYAARLASAAAATYFARQAGRLIVSGKPELTEDQVTTLINLGKKTSSSPYRGES